MRKYGMRDIHTVADLFCGTGAVSCMFADIPGITYVWSNDIEPYAVTLTKARLSPPVNAESMLQKYNAKAAGLVVKMGFTGGWIVKHHAIEDSKGRQTFPKQAAVMLDALDAVVPLSNVYARASLLEAILRSSNGMGALNSALHAKYSPNVTPKLLPLSPVSNNKIRHRVTCLDSAFISINKQFDVIYIDPPYTRSSDYTRQYNLLNTIILRDNPAVVGKYNVRKDAKTSSFSLRSKCDSAFKNLIRECAGKCRYICISYALYALIRIDRIHQLLTEHNFNNIKTYTCTLPTYGAPLTAAYEIMIIASHDPQTECKPLSSQCVSRLRKS